MIRAARLLAATSVAVVALALLTACIQNDVTPAQSWLDGQDGVAAATIVADNTNLYGSNGIVRGELEEGLADDRLDGLVDRVIDYARDHPAIEMRLGYGTVDFVVDGPETTTAREYWVELLDLDDIVGALARGDAGYVHVLRPELRATLEALDDFSGAFGVEAFRDLAAEGDATLGEPFEVDARSAGAYQFWRGADCDPSAEQRSRALDVSEDDAIDEGTVDVCGDYDLRYGSTTDLTVAATAWAQQQDADAVPVPNLTVSKWADGYHEIAVTPGVPALFPVVAAFEVPGSPVVQYWLAADGSLDLRAWDDPAGEVLALLSQSPLAARLPSISLEGNVEGPVGGESVTAIGTLDQLGSLVTEAEALFPLDPAFYQVAIDPESVRIDLYSPPGSDPDMVSAAAALRTSPIWQTRDTYVGYLNGYVLISGGTATIGDDYTDRAPFDAFVEAWNSAA